MGLALGCFEGKLFQQAGTACNLGTVLQPQTQAELRVGFATVRKSPGCGASPGSHPTSSGDPRWDACGLVLGRGTAGCGPCSAQDTFRRGCARAQMSFRSEKHWAWLGCFVAPPVTVILAVLPVFSCAVKCQDWTDGEGLDVCAGTKIISVRFCEKFSIEANAEASYRTDARQLP